MVVAFGNIAKNNNFQAIFNTITSEIAPKVVLVRLAGRWAIVGLHSFLNKNCVYIMFGYVCIQPLVFEQVQRMLQTAFY